MRPRLPWLLALTLTAAIAAAHPTLARAADGELQPGEWLDQKTAARAEGLLPPEILEGYAKGEWRNQIAAFPERGQTFEKEFVAGTEQNRQFLDVDDVGGIIDKRTGKLPARIVGFPFPDIDPKDPKAGVKVVWNFNYMYFNVGNSRSYVDVLWVARDGLERHAGQEVSFLYYDGQKDRYIPEKNPDNLLLQFVATTTSPQDLYGTTALTWRFRESDKQDLVWAYVPALRRIRALSPANRSDGFLGSDMSQDDGPFFDGKPEYFDWKLVGETEMYRLFDPHSLADDIHTTALEGGGWRGRFVSEPITGFEDPSWKGAPWAPIQHKLVKRPVWIVEATPKDKYYLYGKIQLYFDKELFQGAWSRKFSWKGELLTTYIATGYMNHKDVAPDGAEEWFWGAGLAYQAALNWKNDRATVTGYALENRSKAPADRRIQYDPEYFDYQTLYRFGK